MFYLGHVPVVLAPSRNDQTSDSVIAWEVVVCKKCAQFEFAYGKALSVEKLDNRVEARSPIDLDGGYHLPC